jgi:hypothetical protein
VDGDVAEFGTMSGLPAVEMAKTMSHYGGAYWVERKLHLFDSFQGLPESRADADVNSPHLKFGGWAASTCRGLTEEQLLNQCAKYLPRDRIIVHAGWFKDTMLTLPAGMKLARLHIDSDLDQSAIDVLRHAFAAQMIQEGTIILFDNYNCNRAPPCSANDGRGRKPSRRFMSSTATEGITVPCQRNLSFIRTPVNRRLSCPGESPSSFGPRRGSFRAGGQRRLELSSFA